MTGDIINNVAIYEYPTFDAAELVSGHLTEKQIKTAIYEFSTLKSKFERNLNFFIGKNIDIRHIVDTEAPDNLINIPYARKITNTIKGYMFKPGNIQYSLKESENKEGELYFQILTDILTVNKEEIKTAEAGEDQSKYGIAFEIIYNKQDKEGNVTPYFIKLKPQEIIPVYDKTIEKNLICVIRCYKVKTDETTKQDIYKVEVYYRDKTFYYDYKDNEVFKISESINLYGDIPIVIYYNNDDILADYEPIEPLVKLYDKMYSDSANELDRFAAAYLILKNYILGANKEERNIKLKELKSKRLFEVDANGDVRFLTKDIPIEFFKEIKDTIKKEIIKQSQIPNFDDETFGTESGIAIRYKLIDLENLCTFKESYFRDGLLKRIELINKFIQLKDSTIQIAPIKIDFIRNLPLNYAESADLVKKLESILSKETLLGLLPFIQNVQDELDRIQKEKEEAMANFDIDNIGNNNKQLNDSKNGKELEKEAEKENEKKDQEEPKK